MRAGRARLALQVAHAAAGLHQPRGAAVDRDRYASADGVRRRTSLLLRLFQNQDREIAIRRVIGPFHFQLGIADRLYVSATETDQIVRRTLVDDEAEILDRPRPVGAGLED